MEGSQQGVPCWLLHQLLDEGRPKVAVVLNHRVAEHAVELLAGHAVHLIECAIGAGAGVHVHQAQLGAGVGAVAADGGVLRQRAFAAGEGQHAPGELGAAFTLAGHGAFAHAVGDCIGHLLDTLRVGTLDLVQNQHRVVAGRGLDLHAPLGHVPGRRECARVAPH
ncbi:hypothetical protein D3C85_1455220 [compost metagenome]